jgi:ABC-type multidrug transport system ATPase subunit
MKNNDILEADSIEVRYGTNSVLSNVYIKCQQGEIVGLLGRNGCGKSTLLKVIFGALEPEYKSVRINGHPITQGYRQSRITMLPQTSLIPGNIQLREAIRLFKIEPSMIEESSPEIEKLLDSKPDQVSGGELRFIELLMILLDEPFSGLSPVMIEKAISIMNRVREQKGLLITDHLHRYVTSCSDRYYCMTQGRVVEIHDPSQLARYGYLPSA